MKKHDFLFILRAFFFYILFTILSILTNSKIHYFYFYRGTSVFWTYKMASSASFVYCLLMLFSLASVFCLNNNQLKHSFLDRENSVGKLKFALCSKYLWIEFAVLSLFSAIFFYSSPICSELMSGFLANVNIVYEFKTVLAVFIVVTSIFVIELVAMLLTLAWWSQQGAKEKIKNKRNLEFAKELAITVVAWFLTSYTITSVYPMLWTTARVIWMLKYILPIVLALVFIILFAIFYQKTYRQRRKLIKNLKRLSKEQGFEFSVVGHPYRAIIRADEGYHLLIKIGKTKLACKLMSAKSRRRSLYLAEDGFAIYEKKRWFYTRHVMTKYFFDADEDTRKIIIFSPCRSRIFKIRNMSTLEQDVPKESRKITVHNPRQNIPMTVVSAGETTSRQVDVGDKCMGYELYNTSGFINAIERKCI